MKKTILTSTILSFSISAAAVEITNVENIYSKLQPLYQNDPFLYVADTVDGISYAQSIQGGAGIALIDLSNKTNEDIVEILKVNPIPGLPLGIFDNYPELPSDPAVLAEVTSELNNTGLAVNNENYKKLADAIISANKYFGTPKSLDISLTMEGSDDTSVVFYRKQDDSYYQCDKATFQHGIAPLAQPTSCTTLAYGINTTLRDRSYIINYKNGVLLTESSTGLTAFYNGQEYLIPTVSSSYTQYSIADSSTPIITPTYAEDNNIYRLNLDGSVSIISVEGASTNEKNNIILNDNYLIKLTELNASDTVSEFCEYQISGIETICTNNQYSSLPIELNQSLSDPYDFKGYIPFVDIGQGSEFLAYYIGYAGVTVTPILVDLINGEKKSLSTLRVEKLKTDLGEEYINQLTSRINNFIATVPANKIDTNLTPELQTAVTNDIIAQIATNAIPTYILSSDINVALAEVFFESYDPSFLNNWEEYFAALFINSFSEATFISDNSVKTVFGKYSITRDIEVSGTVTLPGSTVPSNGIEVVLLGDMGERLELTTDNNGIFSILNPVSTTYELTFSTDNHVFECANVDLSSGTFGEFEMLAGDVNNDGEVSSADQWIFYLRAFYPSTDFDLNNDGVVNNTDRNIISTNRGAVQCDL